MKLEIQNLSAGYEDDFVLEGLSLSVREGEFLSLLGPSGCGKTTFMKTVAGILPAGNGRIFLDGADITKLPVHKRETVVLFQDLRLFPHLTVAENVAFPLKIQGIAKKERLEQAEEFLEKVQLLEFKDRKPAALSGGQQQRAALARALAARPKLLLLDEPFSALDENLREDMRRLVLRLSREFQMTVILVTHDWEEALAMSDRVAFMFSGKLLQTGTPREVYCLPSCRLAADYFGNSVYIKGTVTGGIFSGGGLLGAVSARQNGVPDGTYELMFRPESLDTETPGDYPLTVGDVSFRGASTLVSLRAADGILWKKSFTGDVTLRAGDRLLATLRTEDGVLFPAGPKAREE